MSAPNKIYLGIGPISGLKPNKRYIYAEWQEEPTPQVENIVYIRKDYLLEWAKKRKSTEQGFESGDAEHGYKSALIDFINKLNEI